MADDPYSNNYQIITLGRKNHLKQENPEIQKANYRC